jgi:hypothetical protein
MSQRINYAQAAAKLDYAALNHKLETLSQTAPPGSQNNALAMLEPLREKLLALHRNGWPRQQLVNELKAAGVPVSAARLREAFNHWTNGGKGATKQNGNNRGKRTPAQPAPSPTTNPTGRGKGASGDNQSGLKLA